MVAHLADNQAIALAQEFPASTETSVTALLQQYRQVNGLDDWAEYTATMHNIALFAGFPRANFGDAQYEAWLALTAP